MTVNVSHKTTDAKGRVTLGGHFANRAVIVEQHGDDAVVVRLACVIPAREAWLYENPVLILRIGYTYWIPAFAGMTMLVLGLECSMPLFQMSR